MTTKLDPNFFFFQNGRWLKIEISGYPCIKTSNPNLKTQYAPFAALNLSYFLARTIFWDLDSKNTFYNCMYRKFTSVK